MDSYYEINQFKQNIKTEIENLINSGEAWQALALIDEYMKVVDDDPDIYNMRAIALLNQGEIDEAERVLWAAIESNLFDSDTLYNFAFLQEKKEEWGAAYRFYNRVLLDTPNESPQAEEVKVAVARVEEKLADAAREQIKHFILLSSCGWGAILQRPHHIARALAKHGHRVSYIGAIRNQFVANAPEVDMKDVVAKSLEMSNFRGLVQIYHPIYVYFNNRIIKDSYDDLVQTLLDSSDADEVVFVSYLPSQIQTIDKLQGNYQLIYECVDDHSDTEYSFWNVKQDREFESQMINRADSVTTTSSSLYLTKSYKKKNIYLSKNAVNRQDFALIPNEEIPEELLSIPGPRVCYIGAIYKWFDEELFYQIVRSNKDLSFVVIGIVENGMLTEKEDNLYVLGPKKHEELKKYLAHMNVGLIPFRVDIDLIVHCDPIKCYEYISCSIPVVATKLPELVTEYDFIQVCNDLEAVNQALRSSLSRKLDEEETRYYLNSNDWHERARLLLNLLNREQCLTYKNETVEKLRVGWEAHVTEENPVLQANYALTFAENDSKKCLELARSAYESLKIDYTLQTYLFASLLNDEASNCIHDVLKSELVADLIKSEIIYLLEQQRMDIVRIRLMMLAKRYDMMYEEIQTLIATDDQHTELAHYYFEIGNYEQANQYYLDIMNCEDKEKRLDSPLMNWNMADIMFHSNSNSFYDSLALRKVAKGLIGKYAVSEQASYSLRKKIRFSVVIPTRNSRNTVEYTIKTCLAQSFDNYEILVSDNSNNNETEQLVKELADSKIKYVRPEQELSMTDHYNFALEHTAGEFIILLGSDDGLFEHALETLDGLLDVLPTKVIRWNLVPYGWPDVSLEGYENFLKVPLTPSGEFAYSWLDGKNAIRSVIQFQAEYSLLPMLYCNSVVHSDLIKELKKKTGKVFEGVAPDVYSGFALAYLQGRYITINAPIAIGGSSGNSTGIAYYHGKRHKDQELKGDFVKLNDKAGLKMHSTIPNVKVLEAAVGEAFIKAKEALFPNNAELELDRKSLIERCILDVLPHDDWEQGLQLIYESLGDDEQLQSWFKHIDIDKLRLSAKSTQKKFTYQVGFSKADSSLIVNAQDFGVTNVFEAALLFPKLSGWRSGY